MKKFLRIISFLLIWGAAVPALAGYGIMWLWNMIVPGITTFTAITFWQGVGLFFLGQLLSAGFIVGFVLLGGISHHGISHHGHHSRWHNMTDEQRREFIARRRQWFETLHTQKASESDE